jgi:hypothetical protein
LAARPQPGYDLGVVVGQAGGLDTTGVVDDRAGPYGDVVDAEQALDAVREVGGRDTQVESAEQFFDGLRPAILPAHSLPNLGVVEVARRSPQPCPFPASTGYPR